MPVDEIEVAPGLWATRHFALWLKEEDTVAISDLHLGFEAALAEQGVSIPRFQRRAILERVPPPPDAGQPEKPIIPGGFKNAASKKPPVELGGDNPGLPVLHPAP